MEKKKTPVSTVIFYIIGIILLIVSLFMLWTAVNYTKTYLASYDATFKDMWSNSMQYIITQFVPYLGMGVICLGLGRAIYGSANAKVAKPVEAAGAAEAKDDAAEEAQKDGEGAANAENAAKAAEPAETASEAIPAAAGAAIGAGAVSAGQMEELFKRIDMNREVLSIKIEEKEKRDSFRIKELEKKVDGFLDDVKYINEPLEELVYKQAAGIDDEEIAAAEAAATEPAAETAEQGTLQKAAGIIPQIFRMARNMAMPAVPEATFEPAKAAPAPAPAAAGAVPQIFTVSRRMTAPACPAVEAAAEEPAPAAAGAVPQIFTVSRRMTAPACPAVEK